MNLEGKKVAILGLGMEGVALFDFLREKVDSIAICDRNTSEKILEKAEPDLVNRTKEILADDSVEKILGEEYLSDLKRFDIVFRSPGIYFLDPDLVKAKACGVVISSQMKLFFELCPCKIIGVTGTKGKGTTASLIFEILKKSTEEQAKKVYLAGNIGKPAITLVPELKKDDIVILELSNFQLADLDRSPGIAVVTNLDIDHLDWHKSAEEYQATKENIVKFQGERDLAILNQDSTFLPGLIDRIKPQIKYFSCENQFSDCVVVDDDGANSVHLDPLERNIEICREDEIRLLGKHNLANIAAATLVCDSLGVEISLIRDAVLGFSGLPHRLEFVAEIDGVKYVNDSFATNPAPTMAAIDAFREDKILILGGSPKGVDFYGLANKIVNSNVSGVILIGQEAGRIMDALNIAGFGGPILDTGADLKVAIEKAKQIANNGEIVIFSPACASFDMFKNYKVRGEEFKKIVSDL